MIFFRDGSIYGVIVSDSTAFGRRKLRWLCGIEANSWISEWEDLVYRDYVVVCPD